MITPAKEFDFKCPKCGSPYFGVVDAFASDDEMQVECHADSSLSNRKCDFVGKYSDFEKEPMATAKEFRERVRAYCDKATQNF